MPIRESASGVKLSETWYKPRLATIENGLYLLNVTMPVLTRAVPKIAIPEGEQCEGGRELGTHRVRYPQFNSIIAGQKAPAGEDLRALLTGEGPTSGQSPAVAIEL